MYFAKFGYYKLHIYIYAYIDILVDDGSEISSYYSLLTFLAEKVNANRPERESA